MDSVNHPSLQENSMEIQKALTDKDCELLTDITKLLLFLVIMDNDSYMKNHKTSIRIGDCGTKDKIPSLNDVTKVEKMPPSKNYDVSQKGQDMSNYSDTSEVVTLLFMTDMTVEKLKMLFQKNKAICSKYNSANTQEKKRDSVPKSKIPVRKNSTIKYWYVTVRSKHSQATKKSDDNVVKLSPQKFPKIHSKTIDGSAMKRSKITAENVKWEHRLHRDPTCSKKNLISQKEKDVKTDHISPYNKKDNKEALYHGKRGSHRMSSRPGKAKTNLNVYYGNGEPKLSPVKSQIPVHKDISHSVFTQSLNDLGEDYFGMNTNTKIDDQRQARGPARLVQTGGEILPKWPESESFTIPNYLPKQMSNSTVVEVPKRKSLIASSKNAEKVYRKKQTVKEKVTRFCGLNHSSSGSQPHTLNDLAEQYFGIENLDGEPFPNPTELESNYIQKIDFFYVFFLLYYYSNGNDTVKRKLDDSVRQKSKTNTKNMTPGTAMTDVVGEAHIQRTPSCSQENLPWFPSLETIPEIDEEDGTVSI